MEFRSRSGLIKDNQFQSSVVGGGTRVGLRVVLSCVRCG
jgi:hypothetical protein